MVDGARAGGESITGAGEGAMEEAAGEHAARRGGVSSVMRFLVSQLKSSIL